jgi:hypothetical protein
MNTATVIRPGPPTQRAASQPVRLTHRRHPTRRPGTTRTAHAGAAHTDTSCRVAPTAGARQPAITTPHGGAARAGHTAAAHRRHPARPAVADG